MVQTIDVDFVLTGIYEIIGIIGKEYHFLLNLLKLKHPQHLIIFHPLDLINLMHPKNHASDR